MDRKYSTITAHWINRARNAKDGMSLQYHVCNALIPLKENQHCITHIYTQCMQASIDIVYTS